MKHKLATTIRRWFAVILCLFMSFPMSDTLVFAEENQPTETITISYQWKGAQSAEDIPTDVILPEADTIEKGSTYTAKQVTSNTHTFDGWYLDEGYTNKFVDGTTLDTDTTLFGKWIAPPKEITPIVENEDEESQGYAWWYKVIIQAEDGSWPDEPSVVGYRLADSPIDPISISHEDFDGDIVQTYELGKDVVFDETNPKNRLSEQYSILANSTHNALRIYYKRLHTVTYEYEGDVPENAPGLRGVRYPIVGREVEVADNPRMKGYKFNGWKVKSPSGIEIHDGKFIMPNEDVVLTGSWTEREPTEPEPTEKPWAYEVHYQYYTPDGEEIDENGVPYNWLRVIFGKDKAYPDERVSISPEEFDGRELHWDANDGSGKETLGVHYIFDENYGPHRLSALCADVTASEENPLKIYYKAAPHTITYEYEGMVPNGAPDVPDMVYSSYDAPVTIADNPTYPGYTFSGWKVKSPEKVTIKNGVLYTPNSDVVLVGTWTKNIDLVGTKNITGRSFQSGDSFTFNVDMSEDAPIPSHVKDGQLTIHPSSKSYAEINFGEIGFHQAGTFTYTFTEEKPTQAIGGIEYDETEYVVTVDVKEKENSFELVPTMTITKDGQPYTGDLIWSNAYNTEGHLDGATHLSGSKQLIGREWIDQDHFTFVLTGGNETTKQKISEGKIILPGTSQSQDKSKTEVTVTQEELNNGVAPFSFEDIVFKNVTTESNQPFVFEIYEKLPEGVDANNTLNGITYDTHKYTISVTVTDVNSDGTLTVTEKETAGSTQFTNTYAPDSTEIELKGTKKVVGHDPLLPTDQFTFTITPENDNAEGKLPINESVQNQNEQISFGTLTFDKDDIGKQFEYKITESGSVSGIKNDSTPILVTITVADNPSTGKVEVSVDYNGKSDSNGFVFTNYSLTPTSFSLKGTKFVEESDSEDVYQMIGNDFTFKVTPASTNSEFDPIEKPYTVSNDNTGNIALFNDVNYTNVGTYTYTVEEVDDESGLFEFDTTKYTVTVVVDTKTDTSGELEIESTITKADGTLVKTIDFNNKYTPAVTTIVGNKTLIGKDIKEMDGLFEFTITPKPETPLHTLEDSIDTVDMPSFEKSKTNNDATGTFDFGKVVFTQPGTYTYRVQETLGSIPNVTYDTTSYLVEFTVEVKDHTLSVTDTSIRNESDSDKTVDEIQFVNTYKDTTEKPDKPETPSGGNNNTNTATSTYAGQFMLMMAGTASLACILTILKKRREI